ncbi:hypothetical protein L596_005282 [Steinernema carpocapsae]|uniref:Uncharacterized protein n=1 Tax=Steinernema carpocapsae TaxID=34508 RepID=A0A4U8UYR7_STECR|nr:hypothetical protein L596_005282 [Steinernema carpocapsae]
MSRENLRPQRAAQMNRALQQPGTSFPLQDANYLEQNQNGATVKSLKEIVSQLHKNPEKIAAVMGLLNDPDKTVEGRKVTRSLTKNAASAPIANFKPIAAPMTFLDLEFHDEDDEEYVPGAQEASIRDLDENSIFSYSDLDSETTTDANRSYQLRSHSRLNDFPEIYSDENMYRSVVDEDYIDFITEVTELDPMNFNDKDEPDDDDFELNLTEEAFNEYENEEDSLKVPRSELKNLIGDLFNVENDELTQARSPTVVDNTQPADVGIPHPVVESPVVPTEPPPQTDGSASLVNISENYYPKFTELESNLLKSQIEMHVQQLMQSIITTHETNGFENDHNECISMMKDIVTHASVSSLSHFSASNLNAAVETVESFLGQLVVWPDIFSNDVFKSHYWQFPSDKVMWTLANSAAVLYPELLTAQRGHTFKEPLNKFLESENLLLAMALVQFRHIKHSSCANRTGRNYMISNLTLVNKTSNQIKYHTKNVKNKNTEIYQLIAKAAKGQDVEFPKIEFVRYDEGPPVQWEDNSVEPFWLKQLRKSLFSKATHCTVTELPRNAIIQIPSVEYDTTTCTVIQTVEEPIVASNVVITTEEAQVVDSTTPVTEQPSTSQEQEGPEAEEQLNTESEDEDVDIEVIAQGTILCPDSSKTVEKSTENGTKDGAESLPREADFLSEEENDDYVDIHEQTATEQRETAVSHTDKETAEGEKEPRTSGRRSTVLLPDDDNFNITETDMTFEEVNMEESLEADITQENDINFDQSIPPFSSASALHPRNDDSLLWLGHEDEGHSCTTFRIQTPTPYQVSKRGACDGKDEDFTKSPVKCINPWGEDSCSTMTMHVKTPQFIRSRDCIMGSSTNISTKASRRIFEIPPVDMEDEATLLSTPRKGPSRRKESELERARCVADPDRRASQLASLAQIIWEDVRSRLFMHDHVLTKMLKIADDDESPEAILESLRGLTEEHHETVLYIIAFLIPRDDWPADLRSNDTCLNLSIALERVLFIEAFNSKAVRRSAIKNIFGAIARMDSNCASHQLYDKLHKHFGSHKILWNQLEELFPDASFSKKVLPCDYEQFNLYDSDQEDVEQFEKVDITSALGKMSRQIVHDVSIDKGKVFVRKNGRQLQVDLTTGAEPDQDDYIISESEDEEEYEKRKRKRTQECYNDSKKRRHRDSGETDFSCLYSSDSEDDLGLDEIERHTAKTTAQIYAEQHQQTATYGNRIPWSEENDDVMISCLEDCDNRIDRSVRMYVVQKFHIGPAQPLEHEIRARMILLKDLVSDYIASKETACITLR